MFGLGNIIGGAMKIGGAIFGGIKASKAAREQQRNLQQQQQANKDWYDRRYNEDATQRADALRMLTATEEALKKSNRVAQGTQAVMGGTNESVAAQKAAANQALADTTSQIAAAAEQRKDAIENQYLQRNDALNAEQRELSARKAQAISNAVGDLGNTAGDIAESFNMDELKQDIANITKKQ